MLSKGTLPERVYSNIMFSKKCVRILYAISLTWSMIQPKEYTSLANVGTGRGSSDAMSSGARQRRAPPTVEDQ